MGPSATRSLVDFERGGCASTIMVMATHYGGGWEEIGRSLRPYYSNGRTIDSWRVKALPALSLSADLPSKGPEVGPRRPALLSTIVLF